MATLVALAAPSMMCSRSTMGLALLTLPSVFGRGHRPYLTRTMARIKLWRGGVRRMP
jgi:hypothetical protein